MQSLTTLLNSVGEMLPNELLDLVLKATAILVFAAFAVRVLRRSSSAIRHGVLTAALLSIIALPLVSVGLPRFEVPGTISFLAAEQIRFEEHSSPPDSYLAANATDGRISPALIGKQMDSRSSLNDSATANSSDLNGQIATLGLGVWILGVLSVLLATAMGEIRTFFLRSSSTEVRDLEWSGSMSEVIRQHRLARRVVFLENPNVSVPMTCGTLHPAVLIPTGFSSSTAERRRILRHEIAHVIRFDVALQTLGRVACAFYWFHPLAWWCFRRMHHEREQACDDWVLRSGERATEYADQLLALARRNVKLRRLSAAAGIVRNGNLEKRVETLLSNDRSHEPMGRFRRAMLLFSSISFCVAVAVVHPQPLNAENPNEATAAQDIESKSDPTKTDSYTVPINATGRAIAANGTPISGATIYMSSQGVLWDTKRIAETTTDDKGRYAFTNVQIPIKRADTNRGRDHGGFILFGMAQGHGFTWRPQKSFYPSPNPNPGDSIIEDPNSERPSRYEREDKIELDLVFPESSTIHGKIVNGDGKPIANTRLALWDAENIPQKGYGPREADSDRRPFPIFDNEGFELLNADVPSEMWISHTNAEGHFAFTGVPAGCRFRVKVQPPEFPSRMVWFSTQAGMKEDYNGYRLHDASKDIELAFQSNRDVPIQVVYADTGKPASKVWVEALNKSASSYKTTDEDGRVSLALPPGEYRLHILRAYGTPYLEADSNFTLGDTAPENAIVAKLPRAGQVEIHVLDKDTGKGIENVDLWRETPGQGRELHYTTGWEVATRIVHRDRQRTDKSGIIKAIFVPGKHRIGVAWQSFPDGYRPVEEGGIEIDCEAGEMDKVVFHLEKTPR